VKATMALIMLLPYGALLKIAAPHGSRDEG
jgi:hypothetical protein